MTELELLERIADALDTIIERMPTWQTEWDRRVCWSGNTGKCAVCGKYHDISLVGLPCPSLTPRSP